MSLARLAPRTFLLAALAFAAVAPARAGVANFEGLSFPAGQDYFSGPVAGGATVQGPYGPATVGTFTSGGVAFENRYDQTYGTWSGFAYSRVDDTVDGYPNEYGAITGTGRGGSGNYGVAFGHHDLTPNLAAPTPFDPTSLADLKALPNFTLPTGASITGMYVTNTTYAYNSMTQGDPFAGTPFGGVNGTDPDYLLLTAYGSDATGHILSATAQFYLGDYRSGNPADHYVVNDWRFMDLSALAGASQIYFNISGTKTGDYGLNTPAYFAVDDIEFSTPLTASVPEPGSLVLLAVGGLGVAALRGRRRAAGALAACLVALLAPATTRASYDPQIGQPGSLGIAKASSAFVEWASSVQSFTPGPQDISNPNSPLANFGSPTSPLGSGGGIVSLGDGGSITLGFDRPIVNGAGADFAVFENGFASGATGLAFLELAFVDVSSDGVNFFRFPSVSLTQTSTQVGGFGLLDASNLHDLAGKYIAGYGTGFDLDELAGVSPLLDVNHVISVRITDVVGSIDPRYGTRDSLGNLINDPFTTPFASGGFDLSGVGVINAAVPEPSSGLLAATAGAMLVRFHRRRGMN